MPKVVGRLARGLEGINVGVLWGGIMAFVYTIHKMGEGREGQDFWSEKVIQKICSEGDMCRKLFTETWEVGSFVNLVQ